MGLWHWGHAQKILVVQRTPKKECRQTNLSVSRHCSKKKIIAGKNYNKQTSKITKNITLKGNSYGQTTQAIAKKELWRWSSRCIIRFKIRVLPANGNDYTWCWLWRWSSRCIIRFKIRVLSANGKDSNPTTFLTPRWSVA